MDNYTADNTAELNALVELGVCSRAKAKRALAFLADNYDSMKEEFSGMGVSERVDLALACA